MRTVWAAQRRRRRATPGVEKRHRKRNRQHVAAKTSIAVNETLVSVLVAGVLAARSRPPAMTGRSSWGRTATVRLPRKVCWREWPQEGRRSCGKRPSAGLRNPRSLRARSFFSAAARADACVACLDAFTGELRWEFKYETRKEDKDQARKMVPGWATAAGHCDHGRDSALLAGRNRRSCFAWTGKTGKEDLASGSRRAIQAESQRLERLAASPWRWNGLIVLPVGSRFRADQHTIPADRAPTPRRGRRSGNMPMRSMARSQMLRSRGTVRSSPRRQLADYRRRQCLVWPGPKALLRVRAADGTRSGGTRTSRAGCLSPQIFGRPDPDGQAPQAWTGTVRRSRPAWSGAALHVQRLHLLHPGPQRRLCLRVALHGE